MCSWCSSGWRRCTSISRRRASTTRAPASRWTPITACFGRGTYQTLDGRTISLLLDGSGAFQVRYPRDGKHAEGDIGKQLLALIDGSKVDAIYPISSGKRSTPTILGRFSVYSKIPGYLPDGMYYPDFFYGGYAIHGYNPAPDYPASHGCMRLPIVDATSVYGWINYGDRVDVYV